MRGRTTNIFLFCYQLCNSGSHFRNILGIRVYFRKKYAIGGQFLLLHMEQLQIVDFIESTSDLFIL